MSDTVCQIWRDNEFVEFVGNKASSVALEPRSLLLVVDSTFHARQLVRDPIVGVRKYPGCLLIKFTEAAIVTLRWDIAELNGLG